MNELEAIEFNSRVTRRRNGEVNRDGACVVYWMQRSQRAYDNPALDIAIRIGNLLRKPVVVFFRIGRSSHRANLRHYHFLAQALKELAADLRKRSVGFVLRRDPAPGILNFCLEVHPCVVIGDENPLRASESLKAKIAGELSVPFWTVDADVIVPSRLLAKEQFAARTIRPRIHRLLDEYLAPLENPLAEVGWDGHSTEMPASILDHPLATLRIDRSVSPVSGFVGGAREARRRLDMFLNSRLDGYATRRNKPELSATSQLSPYLHFGHIGPHTVALAVVKSNAPGCDRDSFLEELIVRRELAVNFVRFNRAYETIESCEAWARATLKSHKNDARTHSYTEAQLENAATHDSLWNAAQKQMMLTGWMHGYLRMYWAKKILEWSPSPAEAYDIAVRLNDRYELDGRDPNGYAGIAWAIAGKHDRPWAPERPVYGRIRYMSYESTSRKFNSKAYMAQIEDLERCGPRQRSLEFEIAND